MTSTAAAPQALSSTPTQGGELSSRPRRNRRPRGQSQGRGERGGAQTTAASDDSLQFVPSNVIHETVTDVQPNEQSNRGNAQRAQRSRGGRRGRASTTLPHGRQFGGTLTSDEPQSAQAPMSLQGDAPTFTPGQSYPSQRTRERRGSSSRRGRRSSKSSAPDIATRIHEDIDNKQYECPICTSEVTRNSKVWSCHTCWTVFHLTCIKQWSSNTDANNAERRRNGETLTEESQQWRCPGCNLPQDNKPSTYTCWCGKEQDPRPLSGLPPHSCGQTCGKQRAIPKKCPHPCELSCHAGPCPPCTRMGPTQRCFCGKESTSRRCVDTDYDEGWSCGQICEDLMPCGEHTCPRECHQGLCGACEVRVDARCYCGTEEKPILCCDKDDDMPSKRTHFDDNGRHVVEEWTGVFQCANTCERPFDCGNHHCQKPCHAQDAPIERCPWSPDLVTRCPCGKTPLDEISDKPRKTCEDPIPNCTKPCAKVLPCGHQCREKCHSGNCAPCMEKISINCRCGRTSTQTICFEASEEIPQCSRICRTTLNCGRHECGEKCCSGERKAAERQASKRKHKPLNTGVRQLDDFFEAEHICTRPCERMLKCGNHICEELCHKGPCGSCREAVFEEISCHCGRTVLQPPLPCGTKPPACRYDCERPKACGHPQVQHNCHSDDELCPKCPFLTEKTCMCGKNKLKNVQCWSNEVRCGEVCGKKLKCGLHTCRKTCHRPGHCEVVSGNACAQTCGRPKKLCGHPCEQKCHAPYPCREETPCTHKTIITCPCQRKRQEVRCNASHKTHGVESTKGNTDKPEQQLECDDECARLARNRQIAHALSIDPDTHTDDHVPYAAATLDMYTDLGPRWSQEQEKAFRIFADSDTERRLRFKPMPQPQRAFLHAMAEDYGLDSESMDPEPHRHVCVFKTPRFVSAPAKTVREALRIRQTQQRLRPAPASAPLPPSKEPYNALLLLHPAFGLTVDDLAAALRPLHRRDLAILFLTADQHVALQPQAVTGLATLKPAVARLLVPVHAAGLELCALDAAKQRVVRREADDVAAGGSGGWSKVAAKGAASASAVQKKEEGKEEKTGRFTVLRGLSGGVGGAKPKKKKEVVVEDWEAAEEEEERIEGAVVGAGEGVGVSSPEEREEEGGWVKVDSIEGEQQELGEKSDKE